MIVKYGAYTHGQNELAICITRRPLRTEANVFYAYEETWTMTAFPGVGGPTATQQSLTDAIAALTNAYSVDGYDLVLYLDDGTTPTAHALYSAACLGGTRVTQPPSFPEGTGAQYSTYRSYSVAVTGEVPLRSENVVTRFHERLEFVGTGGPQCVLLPVASGPWVRQQTSAQSPIRIVQSGSAEGLSAPTTPPAPIWPDAEIVQLRRIASGSPTVRNGRSYNFPINWSYTFESTGPLYGQPNNYPL